MATTQSKTQVIGLEQEKVFYAERGWWLFKWNEVIKKETIGRNIYIRTHYPIDDVFLNGKKLT